MLYISLSDLFVVPFYIALLFFFAIKIRDKYYPENHELRKYFIPGLAVKITGALGICFIYIFYFGYGDTFGFFDTAKTINSSFAESPATWFRLLTHNPDLNNITDSYYWSILQENFYNSMTDNYIVGSIAAVIGIFCFNHFLCIALIMGCLAYTGLWALLRTFVKLYPDMPVSATIATLFLPDVALWGSGIFKDTICMFLLGWLIFYFFKVITEKRVTLTSLIVIILCSLIIGTIKIYIIGILAPVLFLRMILGIMRSLKNTSAKLMLATLLSITLAGAFYKLGNAFSDNLTDLVVENVTETITGFANTAEDGGSSYSLGPIDGSLTGLIKKAPAAVNVALYRPYIWESRKPISLLAALESCSFLVFSLYLIFKARWRIFTYLVADLNLLAFLLFSILFAYAVGITAYNFGTLSRFKIPCMPFFVMSLFIINHHYHANKKNSEPDLQEELKNTGENT